eukprot:850710-Prymnesium_polylepis.1
MSDDADSADQTSGNAKEDDPPTPPQPRVSVELERLGKDSQGLLDNCPRRWASVNYTQRKQEVESLYTEATEVRRGIEGSGVDLQATERSHRAHKRQPFSPISFALKDGLHEYIEVTSTRIGLEASDERGKTAAVRVLSERINKANGFEAANKSQLHSELRMASDIIKSAIELVQKPPDDFKDQIELLQRLLDRYADMADMIAAALSNLSPPVSPSTIPCWKAFVRKARSVECDMLTAGNKSVSPRCNVSFLEGMLDNDDIESLERADSQLCRVAEDSKAAAKSPPIPLASPLVLLD